MDCPACNTALTRAILAQDGPTWMCTSCYTRAAIRCRSCDGEMHRIEAEWAPRADAGKVACPGCGTAMRVKDGAPVWISPDEDARERAIDAKRRPSAPPPIEVEKASVEPFAVPSPPVAKPKQLRKPKAFAREMQTVHAEKAGFRDSAEPERLVEMHWKSTRRNETTTGTRAALALAVVIPTLFMFGADGRVIWFFVAAFLGFAIAAFRQRPEKLAEHSVRVQEHEVRVDDQVVPRVRVEGVVVRSSEEDGLHRVVLKGAEVVVDETSKLEHALWIERELKRELEATE